MADQSVTVDMDDRELFNSAMADEPQQVETPDATEPTEQDGQPRDEHGRFAAKTEADKPAEPTAPQDGKPEADKTVAPTDASKDDQGGQVPSWRLREVREAREAAERRATEADQERYALREQLAEMRRQIEQQSKPKQEPVDFFQNPDEAFQQRLGPLEERFAQFEARMRLNSSRALAIATHGAETVNEMDQAIAKAMRENHPDLQHLAAQMRASDDPVNLAVQWHKRTKLWDTTGGDPEAYRQKVLDEALKDPKFQAKVLESARAQAGAGQGNGNPSAVKLPPSLNKAPGTGSNDTAAFTDADMSDAALFRHAMSDARR